MILEVSMARLTDDQKRCSKTNPEGVGSFVRITRPRQQLVDGLGAGDHVERKEVPTSQIDLSCLASKFGDSHVGSTPANELPKLPTLEKLPELIAKHPGQWSAEIDTSAQTIKGFASSNRQSWTILNR